MAAVLCLVMIPTFASIGFMIGGEAELTLGSVFAIATFTLLAAGMFLGAFNMSRSWDAGVDDH